MPQIEDAPLEPFLIVFKHSVSRTLFKRLTDQIQDAQGNILLITGDKRSLIATLTQTIAESLRKSPQIEHVGGVRIGQRKIVRKQVRQE